MIQTISAMPAGVDLQGFLAGVSGQGESTPFMALFAQAITAQAEASAGANPLMLGEAAGLAKQGEVSDAMQALSDTDVSALDPALLAASGFPIPGHVGMAVLASNPELGASEGGGKDAGQLIEPTTLASSSGGKKLPDLMAVLAGRPQSVDATVDLEPQSVGTAPGMAVSLEEGVDAAMLTAAPEKSLPGQPAGPLGAPVAGQESTLMVARQAAVAHQDRPVLMMQNGLGSAAWQQELGDKLVWMTGRQGQMAELILNPPSLGAVEVRLNLSGAEASAQFYAANPGVRDVIESALPRLREMMGGAGITLGEATVSDQSFGQRDRADRSDGPAKTDNEAALNDEGAAMGAPIVRMLGTGVLDYFA